MNHSALLSSIYNQLTEDQSTDSLWSDLAGKIYHLQGPPDGQLPMLIYRIHLEKNINYFNGNADTEIQLEFEVWQDVNRGFIAVDAIYDKLIALLHQQHLLLPNAATATIWLDHFESPKIKESLLKISSRWQCRIAS